MASLGEYHLLVLNGDMAGHSFALDRNGVSIGRNAANEVCLPLDPLISRWHAQVELTPDGVTIEDRNSGNGTWVGQTRTYTAQTLSPGAQIRVGRTWMQLNFVPTETAEPLDASQQIIWLDEEDEAIAPAAAEESIVYSVDLDDQAHRASNDVEELRRRLHAFELVATALGWSLDLQTVLVTLVDTVMQVMKAERGFILLVEPTTGEFEARVARQPQSTDGEGIQISRHIINRALSERIAILTSDAMHDKRFQDVESVVGFQIRSAVCIPIFRGDRDLGVLYIDTNSTANVFSESDLEMLTGLANQAAHKGENSRRYNAQSKDRKSIGLGKRETTTC